MDFGLTFTHWEGRETVLCTGQCRLSNGQLTSWWAFVECGAEGFPMGCWITEMLAYSEEVSSFTSCWMNANPSSLESRVISVIAAVSLDI